MDKVCHFEVPYDDKERMEKFYSGVFGWTFTDAPGDMPYTFAMTTEVNEQMMPKEVGGINGGTYARADEGAKSPVIVLQVDSCEQRLKDVESGGGKALMGPHEIPGMGIYGQVQDTEGNIIGLWQPASHG